jgi:hypothetical protein
MPAASTTPTSPTVIQSGTVEGLIEFINWAVAKGYSPAPSAANQKAATRFFFTTLEGEDVDLSQIDVQNVDVDDLFRRFDLKARGKLKAESISSYKSRVVRAIESYRRFLESGTPPTHRQSKRRKEKPGKTETPEKPNGNGHAHPAMPTALTLDYPFPLRAGGVANLRLPRQLEKEDADRLAAFIRTLVFEPQLALPPGEPEDV